MEITMYHSSSSVFMTNKTPSGARKHCKSTKQRTRKTKAKCFSSDRLAQYCMNLSRWFTHKTAAFCTELCKPHYLFTTSKSREALVTTHSKTMASSLGRPFHSYLYACALKDHLAMKGNYYSKSLN